MAVAVCIPLPKDGNAQMQWDFVLSNFAVDTLYVIGDEADAPVSNVFSGMNATYIASAEGLPAVTLIVLAADNGKYVQGTTSLVGFSHPEDVIYLFGGDSAFLSEDELGSRVPDDVVFIPTDSKDDMWSWSAFAVVMWDRRYG